MEVADNFRSIGDNEKGARGIDEILGTGSKGLLSSSFFRVFASKEEDQGMKKEPEQRI